MARKAQCWLGVSAISFGLGAAMLTGGAAAHADTGESDASGQTSLGNRMPGGPARAQEESTPRPTRPSVGSRSPRAAAVVERTDSRSVPDANDSEIPAAPEPGPMTGAGPVGKALSESLAPPPEVRIQEADTRTGDAGDTALDVAPGVTLASVASTPSAGEVISEQSAAKDDPSWNMDSYLGGVKVVPGSSVKLAQQEISAAQEVLNTGTWGSGDVAAGLVSLVPQLFLAQAAWALTTWQDSIEQAKSAFADTVGVPILHELAGLSLVATMTVPSLATAALQAASVTTPLVGVFGAAEAASQAQQLVDQAQLDGLVYAVVPFVMGRGVNQTATVSVNGGPSSPVVVDTGSSGLSITMQYVGQSGLGKPTGTGTGGYGVPPTEVYYDYDKYTTRFGFTGSAHSGPTTVNIVQDVFVAAFNNYQYPDGVVGVLGLAANRGSGPNNIVAFPGELKDGVLILQLGVWGFAVLGPNPLPVRGSVAGVPDAYTQVQINGGPKQKAKTLIDSGGVYGYVPPSVVPPSVVGSGQTSGDLPAGTRVSVYTGDGETLLYSYITTAEQPLGIVEGDEFNTGNIPFQLGPIYIDYSQPDGIGTTAFCQI